MHVEKSWCGPNIDSLAIGNNLLQHIIRDMHNVMHSRHAAFHFQVYDKEREVNHITELFICTYRKIIIRGALKRGENKVIIALLVLVVLQLVLLGSTGLVILPLRYSVSLGEDINWGERGGDFLSLLSTFS